jgi:hypothetical protein
MDVEIGEVALDMRAIDERAPLAPEVMRRIVHEVLKVLEERSGHAERVRAERRITGGVAEERESEEE